MVPQPGFSDSKQRSRGNFKNYSRKLLNSETKLSTVASMGKQFKTYHSTTMNTDDWGVSYNLDEDSAEFKSLPLGLEVNYLDSNFNNQFTRSVD
jgi:hypothetical protein